MPDNEPITPAAAAPAESAATQPAEKRKPGVRLRISLATYKFTKPNKKSKNRVFTIDTPPGLYYTLPHTEGKRDRQAKEAIP